MRKIKEAALATFQDVVLKAGDAGIDLSWEGEVNLEVSARPVLFPPVDTTGEHF